MPTFQGDSLLAQGIRQGCQRELVPVFERGLEKILALQVGLRLDPDGKEQDLGRPSLPDLEALHQIARGTVGEWRGPTRPSHGLSLLPEGQAIPIPFSSTTPDKRVQLLETGFASLEAISRGPPEERLPKIGKERPEIAADPFGGLQKAGSTAFRPAPFEPVGSGVVEEGQAGQEDRQRNENLERGGLSLRPVGFAVRLPPHEERP